MIVGLPGLAQRAGRGQLIGVRHRHDGADAAWREPDAPVREAGAHATGTDDERRRDAVDSFEPFVRRAEHNARAHQVLFDVPGTSGAPPAIGHRAWYMADNLVTVELHLKP